MVQLHGQVRIQLFIELRVQLRIQPFIQLLNQLCLQLFTQRLIQVFIKLSIHLFVQLLILGNSTKQGEWQRTGTRTTNNEPQTTDKTAMTTTFKIKASPRDKGADQSPVELTNETPIHPLARSTTHSTIHSHAHVNIIMKLSWLNRSWDACVCVCVCV